MNVHTLKMKPLQKVIELVSKFSHYNAYTWRNIKISTSSAWYLYLFGAVGASVLGFMTATFSNAWQVSFTRAKSCSPRSPKPEVVSTSKLLEMILCSALEKWRHKEAGQSYYYEHTAVHIISIYIFLISLHFSVFLYHTYAAQAILLGTHGEENQGCVGLLVSCIWKSLGEALPQQCYALLCDVSYSEYKNTISVGFQLL